MNITLHCIDCGQELEYAVSANQRRGIEFSVTLCDTCLDEKTEETREEGYAQGHEEGKKEGYDEFFQDHRLREPDEA